MYRARPVSVSQQAAALRALWPGCHVVVRRQTLNRRGRGNRPSKAVLTTLLG
jgi:hypothetical protein